MGDPTELKVWVEGVERSISGVTEKTSCTQLIYALAHATGQKGRFVLVECYGNTERSLSPSDRPLEMLRRWNDKATDVSFLMRKLDGDIDSSEGSSAASSDSSSLPFANQRESSYSSIASVNLPFTGNGRSNMHPGPAFHQQSSSSSLPAYSDSSLQRRRPPPPDYASTMSRRMAMGAATASTISSHRREEAQRTPAELVQLIQQQDAILEEQRSRLAALAEAPNADEAEYAQLDTQQKNLRRVLETLRVADWGRRYEEETLKNRQLRAKLLATQEKLSLCKESHAILTRQEADLWEELTTLAQEDASLFCQREGGVAFPFVGDADLKRVHTAI